MCHWLPRKWWDRESAGQHGDGAVGGIRTWFSIAVAGMKHIAGEMVFTQSIAGVLASLVVNVTTGSLEGWGVLLERVGGLHQHWDNFMHIGGHGITCLLPGGSVSVATVFLFLLSTTPRIWSPSVHLTWQVELQRFLGKVLAMGFESHIYHRYVHSQNLNLVVRSLRGTKRNLAVDPPVVEDFTLRAKHVGGSSNQSMTLLSQQKGLDSRVTMATLLLHREAHKKLMGGARAISVMWDPATYSNKSWNLGLMARLVGGWEVACDLVPKVTVNVCTCLFVF